MKRDQVFKLLKLGIVVTFIMLLFEIVFSIDAISEPIANWITSSSGWLVYLAIWFIMFLQVTILNIPAYVILTASINVGLKTLSFPYLLTVISAYMAGCLLAYAIGRKFGVKAIKWVAGSEEEFNKWSLFLNQKGKWYYFFTINIF